MGEIQEITSEKLVHIAKNLIPGGFGTFYDEPGSAYTDLWLFHDDDQVMLLVEDSIQLSTQDDVVGREIISLNDNPELAKLYDWFHQCFDPDEVMDFLQHFHCGVVQESDLEAGSVSDFGETSPTTTISTHDS